MDIHVGARQSADFETMPCLCIEHGNLGIQFLVRERTDASIHVVGAEGVFDLGESSGEIWHQRISTFTDDVAAWQDRSVCSERKRTVDMDAMSQPRLEVDRPKRSLDDPQDVRLPVAMLCVSIAILFGIFLVRPDLSREVMFGVTALFGAVAGGMLVLWLK